MIVDIQDKILVIILVADSVNPLSIKVFEQFFTTIFSAEGVVNEYRFDVAQRLFSLLFHCFVRLINREVKRGIKTLVRPWTHFLVFVFEFDVTRHQQNDDDERQNESQNLHNAII